MLFLHHFHGAILDFEILVNIFDVLMLQLGNSDLPSSLLAQSSMTDSKEIVKVKEEVEEDSSM